MKKEIEITIPELPPTDNMAYRNHGHVRYMIKEAKKWKEMVHYLGFEQCIKPTEGKVKMFVTFYLKRDRDAQGSLKLLCDALEDIVYFNDKQIWNYNVKKILNNESRKNPRIELKIIR